MTVHKRPRRVSTEVLIELEYWAGMWFKRKPGSMKGLKSALRAFLSEMSATREK